MRELHLIILLILYLILTLNYLVLSYPLASNQQDLYQTIKPPIYALWSTWPLPSSALCEPPVLEGASQHTWVTASHPLEAACCSAVQPVLVFALTTAPLRQHLTSLKQQQQQYPTYEESSNRMWERSRIPKATHQESSWRWSDVPPWYPLVWCFSCSVRGFDLLQMTAEERERHGRFGSRVSQ